MKRILLLFLFCLPILGFGQETKTIEKHYGASPQIASVENVLISNPAIKQGPYMSFYKMEDIPYRKIQNLPLLERATLKEVGYYKNNLKDSTWEEYTNKDGWKYVDSLRRPVLSAKGNYSAGKKVGIWEEHYWTSCAEIVRNFNYSTNTVVGKPKINYYNYIFSYPEKARDSGYHGTVVIQYTVHKDCSVGEIEKIKSVKGGCDEEAIRFIKTYWQCTQEALLKYYEPINPCEKDTTITCTQDYNIR
jgi:hypothetical protein